MLRVDVFQTFPIEFEKGNLPVIELRRRVLGV